MNKLIIIPLLMLLLSGCTSTASNVGVENNLYNEGKEIIQFTASNIHSKQMEYSTGQQSKINDFQSKYEDIDLKDNELQFYQLVMSVIKSYNNYGDSINELKTKFNMTVDY